MSEMKKIEISILKRVSHSYIFMNSVNVWSIWDFRCLELAKKYYKVCLMPNNFESFLYLLWHFTKIPFPANICTPREVSLKGYQLLNKLLMELWEEKKMWLPCEWRVQGLSGLRAKPSLMPIKSKSEVTFYFIKSFMKTWLKYHFLQIFLLQVIVMKI